jgi:multidrug efflux pump subunit AcrA (membrane-fusion protein)
VFGLILVAAIGVAAAYLAQVGPFRPLAPVPTVEAPPAPRPMARGRVRPVGQARVGTLAGGVVQTLSVAVGDSVAEQQELARVKGAASTEVLTAPWRGTVVSLPVQAGDTVVPGSVVAVVADLRGLQVETTDVDEFLIAGIQPGQPVSVTVDALDRRELAGIVRTVSLYVQKNDDGDDHFPVVVDLYGSTTALRPSMSVRVYFGPE